MFQSIMNNQRVSFALNLSIVAVRSKCKPFRLWMIPVTPSRVDRIFAAVYPGFRRLNPGNSLLNFRLEIANGRADLPVNRSRVFDSHAAFLWRAFPPGSN